ncbi:MAG TPA: aminomethyl-transferring glycine dehydrogenase subunit GcvPB [Nitrospiria bacterium]|nr:aminomethyl-transferring glycine dehydrogenase subunit GcvPB [Nitrospiria bacterium]
MGEPLIFEKSVPGRKGYSLPDLDVPEVPIAELMPAEYLRKDPPLLPELSEVDVVRHFTNLSRDNYGIDQGFYPLGSCTMKYNPKVNEDVARFAGFAALHPLQPVHQTQGALQVLYQLEAALREITGMDRVTLQPAAGAQGELVGMLMIRAYHRSNGNTRRKVIVPDAAHGTNPATATLAGYEVQVVHSNADGLVDLDDLKHLVNPDTAALMLTNPNTLGLFERDILKIAELLHGAGALLYLDGANLNALLGLCRPGDMGFDVVHSNLHKTFTTPHGGGGPGAGALGVKSFLSPFLPVPVVEKTEKGYVLDDRRPQSIGKVQTFYGNFGNLVRAYTYIRRMGAIGFRKVSTNAILNANYIRKRLEEVYPVPYNRFCMHEFVASAKKFRDRDVHAWDIAKRLIDYGIYPPTVNFPLVVEEALMIEPTETEPKENLDRFCEAMLRIAKEIEEDPELVKKAPHSRTVTRLDEIRAVKELNLRWNPA